LTDNAIAIKIKYPDEQFDAESLLINPQNGDLYFVTKMYVGAAQVYKLSPPFVQNKTNVLQNIGEIKVTNTPEGLFTGGEISPDGERLVLCDYLQAYEFVLPNGAKNFDDIWKQTPQIVKLSERSQGEAICYGDDGKAIFATSEKRNSPLIKVARK
ncbi:MAG: hypothetical protein H7Z37_15190, partial [Pyrinomonadaceae bacterium]|nr:hypothetical protein [Pyrinomonadaceae bacterium]